MSNVLYFKESLTIKEASQYLSKVFNEKVKIKDIYRLAIGDKLVLSLYFSNSTYVEKKQIQPCLSLIKQEMVALFSPAYYRIKLKRCLGMVNVVHCQLLVKQIYYGNHSKFKLKAYNEWGIILNNKQTGWGYYQLISYFKQNRIKIIKKDLHCKERLSLYKVFANIINTAGDSLGIDSPIRHTIAKYLKETSHYLSKH